ncbi:hypothetical protein EDD18DRAFT_1142443 [Armillaria luteobubalina]|uniref:BRCT domain-containing protein n=1 Tax=Armillaria luteobubalina TaxID=153913 RepID=A0AA39QEC6_9AGAR|nr:hypothetical protein EDD18DRAFT_1142443 [Armillaria luteobubalina]
MNLDFSVFFAEQDEHMRLSREAFQQYLSQKSSASNSEVSHPPSTSSIPSSAQTRASDITPELDMDVDLVDKSPRKQTGNLNGYSPPPPHSPTASGQMRSAPPSFNCAAILMVKGSSSLPMPACISRLEETSLESIVDLPENPAMSSHSHLPVSGARRTPGTKLTPSSSIEEISKDSFDEGTKMAKTKQETSNKALGARKQHAAHQAAINRPVSPSTTSNVHLLPSTSARTSASSLELDIARCIANHSSKRRQPRVHKASTLSNNPSPISLDSVSVIHTSSSPQPSTSAIKKVATSKRKNNVNKATKAGKSAKEKNVKKSPAEWVAYLLEEQKALDADPNIKKKVTRFLTGKNIYYCGVDQDNASDKTRQRLRILVKFGANLQTHFDPKVVTEIIVSEVCTLSTLLGKCGLRRISDIPDHIPTLKWEWVSNRIGQAEKGPDRNVTLLPYDRHPAYHERFHAGLEGYTASGERIGQISSTKKRTREDSRDAVHDSESEDEVESSEDATSTSKLGVSASEPFEALKDDPLAPFYDQAREEHENQWTRYGEAEEDDQLETNTESDHKPVKLMKRHYACDDKGLQVKQVCPNQDVVDRLSELKGLHAAKAGREDYWKVFAYTRDCREGAFVIFWSRVPSVNNTKIWEILQTGGLRRIKYETTEEVIVSRVFQGIYGVGLKTSLLWYGAGNRTLDDIRTEKYGSKLSNAQKIGLKYYDDINSRMPRNEAKALFDLIKPIALSIDPKLFVEIMGSYRRGKADCGDIDIMITRCPDDDGKTHAGVLGKLLKKLRETDIITEDLAAPENIRDLEAIYRGLCHLPQEGSRQRRIDFLTIPWRSRGAALLYYTFNRALRLKANHMGYSLNEKGLWEGVIRDPSNRSKKLNNGTIKASETEEEIFKILNVPYQEPHERVRNFA